MAMLLDGTRTPSSELTLTVLGCGNLGRSILRGVLISSRHAKSSTTPSDTEIDPSPTPPRIPTRFIACVTRPATAKLVEADIGPLTPHLSVRCKANVDGARDADVVLLACKPQMAATILHEPGMAEALRGKLLISILSGVTVAQIESHLQLPAEHEASQLPSTRVVRAMPNTASAIGESMTVIATPEPPLPGALMALTTWIFSRIGRVVELPGRMMDACTALCGSGPAFFALVLEAMADGAVAMGIPRREAQLMAAQTMRGAAGLVLEGEHPALLREKVCTPGGCTIGGLLVLEEGRVRGNVARAVREATVVAGLLGSNATGVNGTHPKSGS